MENITMQQLKEQRLTPAERFVLDKVNGAKASEVYGNGDVIWYGKDDGCLFTQDFNFSVLWVSDRYLCIVLVKDYGLKNYEIKQLLTNLLRKYTNNGQLKIL